MRSSLFVVLLFVSFPAMADVSTLEGLTSEWVALRAERAREVEAWRDEQSRIRLELSLLKEAGERLREELEHLRERGDVVEAAQADVLAELTGRETAQEGLRPALVTARASLNDLLAALPLPLRRRVDEEAHALEAAGADLLQQVRAVLALQNQVLQLQTGLLVAPQVIELEGERREMDVLWIGSSRALAVSGNDTLAARGKRVEREWQWTVAPGKAASFRHALRLALGEAPPALVNLPVEAGP